MTGILNKQEKEIYIQKEIEKERDVEQEKQIEYLNKTPKWRLNPQQLEKLNKSITLEEIQQAWKKQKSGKSPGPDGLPAEYYKAFEEILSPQFKKLTEDIESKGVISNSWKEAHITLIHKDGTEKNKIKNYRPISLLNVDYKIFTTIWASRLKEILREIIHTDQTGFLPRRKLSSNIRTIIDI